MWNPYFHLGSAMLSLACGKPSHGVARLNAVYREAVAAADSFVAARVAAVARSYGVDIEPFGRPGGVVLGRRVSLVK